ncbi:unnamed protein product [Porites lobata]|uniref:Uncharacterized protein n=1 Tax=Porites lobata TaxID=104759 RepID=A0ABN8P7S5_9CNID|nr:unnamed protein product [Porites lobata]
MSFLHYITFKLVVIRDKRIGSIYYTLAAVIVLYTLAEIFLKKGYLEFDTSPEATMRFLLSDPKEDVASNSEQTSQMSNLSYCCTKGEPTKMCTPCQVLDARELLWPVESRTISLTTFAKDRWQTRNTSLDIISEFKTVREKMYFTAQPESMMIKIEHAVLATKFSGGKKGNSLAASQRNMKGFLYGLNGTILRRQSNYLSNEDNGPRGRADKFTVREILHAAGVESLDEPSDALNAKGKPFRRHGIVLRVAINYQNSDSSFLGTGDITYSYHVRRIPFADYRVNEVIPVLSEKDFTDSSQMGRQENRLFRKRYGIKIEFHQTGRLGHFSLSSLLLRLASGVGLLTLTATVVDILALYILPDKVRYRKYVYEESPILEMKKEQ